MKVAGAGHVGPHGLFAVLDQDGGPGVLEDDVVARVAAVELARDLGVQVVAGVLGLPVARAMRRVSLTVPSGTTPEGTGSSGTSLSLSPVVAAVGVQAVLERGPDVQLAVRAAVLDQVLFDRVVVLYVRVGGHGKRIQDSLPTRAAPTTR